MSLPRVVRWIERQIDRLKARNATSIRKYPGSFFSTTLFSLSPSNGVQNAYAVIHQFWASDK
jgi:hypothetical protein